MNTSSLRYWIKCGIGFVNRRCLKRTIEDVKELEDIIMRQIGLGQHYAYSNGSRSCRHIREEALRLLPIMLRQYGLTFDPKWKAHCDKASFVDSFIDYQSILTNTWIACSNAIRDAIERNNNGNDKGFTVVENWKFEDEKQKESWLLHENSRRMKR